MKTKLITPKEKLAQLNAQLKTEQAYNKKIEDQKLCAEGLTEIIERQKVAILAAQVKLRNMEDRKESILAEIENAPEPYNVALTMARIEELKKKI